MTNNDFGDCPNQTLRTINFQLKIVKEMILIYTVIIGHFLLYSREWKKYSFLLCNFYKILSIILHTR